MDRPIKKVKAMAHRLKAGQSGMVLNEIGRWLYSDSFSFGLRRDLTQAFETPDAKIPLTVRPLEDGDMSVLFDMNAPGITRQGFRFRMNMLNLLKADIPTCYVAVTSGNKPRYLQWLIGHSENDEIHAYCTDLYPLLAPDEALTALAFTLGPCRGQGIMPCAMSQIAEGAEDFGARWVIAFVSQGNIPSLKGCKRAGFVPYLIRREEWRLFRRRSTFVRCLLGHRTHSILNKQQIKTFERLDPEAAGMIKQGAPHPD